MEKVLEMKIQETQSGSEEELWRIMKSYEELCITMVLRILVGQSIKTSVIITTKRNNEKYNRKNK